MSIARSSAGMASLNVLWSLPITEDRAFLLPKPKTSEYDALGKLAQKVASSMPEFLQLQWNEFEPHPDMIKASSEGRPLEEVEEDGPEDQEGDEPEDQEGGEPEDQEGSEPEDQEASGPEDEKEEESEPDQDSTSPPARSQPNARSTWIWTKPQPLLLSR